MAIDGTEGDRLPGVRLHGEGGASAGGSGEPLPADEERGVTDAMLGLALRALLLDAANRGDAGARAAWVSLLGQCGLTLDDWRGMSVYQQAAFVMGCDEDEARETLEELWAEEGDGEADEA